MTHKYRPEIDGLRALAVLAVVFYHAELVFYGFDFFKGGYVGVDVFFVISGYLITLILLKDLAANKFSLLKFYERRARRLLPALFLVMLASIPFAWLYMMPKALKEYAESILSSLLFSSNFFFWTLEGYWAEPSALQPFLHTWSLSLEEQFYLIFPVALFLLWKVAPKHILKVFVVMAIASLIFAEFFTKDYPKLTFFLLPARAWQLLAGSMLAKLQLDYGRQQYGVSNKILPGAGILLIIYAVVFFDSKTYHPSFITVIPVLGTMLFIWFAHKDELFSKVFSSRALVGTGLISYSLYLWHYPVFAFFRIYNKNPSLYDKLLWIVISTLLAIMAYFLVERPLRYTKKISKKFFLASLAAVFCGLLFVQFFFYKTDGVPSRLPFSKKVWLTFKEADFGPVCNATTEEELFDQRWCKIGDKESSPSFIVFGDSHAKAMMEMFHLLGKKHNKSGLFLMRSGCPPMLGVYPERGSQSAERCKKMNDEALGLTRSLGLSEVFIVGRWDYYLNSLDKGYQQKINTVNKDFSAGRSRKVFASQMRKTLLEYDRTNASIVLMLQAPHHPKPPLDVYVKVASRNLTNSKNTKQQDKIQKELEKSGVSLAKHNQRNAMANKIIFKAAQGIKNLHIIDPTDSLCSVEFCKLGDADGSHYADEDHLSPLGSQNLIHLFTPHFL